MQSRPPSSRAAFLTRRRRTAESKVEIPSNLTKREAGLSESNLAGSRYAQTIQSTPSDRLLPDSPPNNRLVGPRGGPFFRVGQACVITTRLLP
jgi:hypothetical protein